MLETIIAAVLSSGTCLAIVIFLSKSWVKERIKSSIQHEYKKQFELFSRELDQKEKVQMVAELFSEYLRTPYGEAITREQRNRLNYLSFQSSLWLPKDIATEISKRLQNKNDAKSVFEIILMAREALIGCSELELEHVTFWGHDKETKGDPVLHVPEQS
ncbi:hypothetical protein KDX31_06825 [Amphritea atlantica]|uniref:Uncharacterized protein n=1 Tax=Amphritea atlantica TaxID=355243 RepID=A0ABY5GXG4_9GAMM|nr:hypothetical protein KDX31_06825 [Amphritea atlantica]